jgi:hypothetical protein
MSDDWVPTVEQIRLFKEAEAAYGDEAVFNEIAGRLHEQLGRKFWSRIFCFAPSQRRIRRLAASSIRLRLMNRRTGCMSRSR